MPLYPQHGAYFTTYFCNKINKHRGGIFVLCRVEFSKIGKRDFTLIREMRVHYCTLEDSATLVYFYEPIKRPLGQELVYFSGSG